MMTLELFPAMPSTLSPMRAWMARHDIQTLPPAETITEDQFSDQGFDPIDWIACQGEINPASHSLVSGKTEEDALATLAEKLNLQFYK